MALTGLCADGFGRRFGAKGFLVTELGQVAAVAAEAAEVARGGAARADQLPHRAV